MNQKKNSPPLEYSLASAAAEVAKAVYGIRQKYGLPSSLMDGLLSTVQAELRLQAQAELIEKLQNKGGENQDE